jgi:UDP-N-acetylmuramyl pentapeptide phosphotransferase/UDP-N-acetylglucosamine-1-phosphate transferase
MISWILLPAAAVGGAVTTGLVTRVLKRRAILDHPNERSSHAVPTPRGGGWGILLVLVPGWAALGVAPAVLVGLAGLAAVSWLDDRRGVPPGPRLLVQAAAIAFGLSTLGDHLVFQGWLPWDADRAVAAFCWLWFVNLFNFMDGIDGLAGGETVSVAAGLALVAGVAGLGPDPAAFPASGMIPPALVLAGAALGFLVWNWQPARVFLGDVGSIPLGFALGWLLLVAAAAGLWPAAVLLPLVFVTDASLTLLRRLAAGQRVWQAHREHFYQRAVRGGRSHAWVVRAVLATNLVLIALALAAPWLGWPVLVAGALAVLGLLWRLQAVAR